MALIFNFKVKYKINISIFPQILISKYRQQKVLSFYPPILLPSLPED